jgi:hypothetical protein
MNIYILTYPPGTCGNFINYFINRHKSFPIPEHIGKPITSPDNSLADNKVHYKRTIRIFDSDYIKSNREAIERTLSELGHNNIESRIDNIFNDHELESTKNISYNSNNDIHAWAKDYQRKSTVDNVNPIYLNEEFDSISFIPIPTHNLRFFIDHPHYIDHKHITINLSSEFSRLTSATLKRTLNECKYISQLKDSIQTPLHVIDLLDLLNHSLPEYNKLLDFIEQPPLDNWKELITDYTDTIGI